MTQEEIAAFYELKIKHEERTAVLTVTGIILGIFIGLPALVISMLLELIDADKSMKTMSGLIIMLILVIVILAVLTLCNAFRAGRMFRLMQKHKNLSEMVAFLNQMEQDQPQFHTAYILLYYQFCRAYMQDENLLVIIYHDGTQEQHYHTCCYRTLCRNSCEEAILDVTADGLFLIEKTN